MSMDLSKVDLYNTIKSVRDRGGAIFYDRVPAGSLNITAGGTGTSRTSISTSYAVPSAAQELLAVSGGIAPTAEAAADQVFGFMDIQGTSYKRQPQQFPAPLSGTVLSAGQRGTTPQEWWAVRSKVTAGDQYDWGFTPFISNAHNTKVWDDVMYSTIPSGLPNVYSQVQTTVNTFKTAGSNSAGTLTLTAAAELYEVATLFAPEAAAVAQENQIMDTNLQCSALDPIQSFNYAVGGSAVVVSTTGESRVDQIARHLCVGNKFKVPNPTLSFTDNLGILTSNNITTSHLVRYTAIV